VAVRPSSGLPASGGSEARLGGRSNERELLSGTVKISRAKDAEWLKPNGIAVGCPAAALGAHGHSRPPVYRQGLTHSCHQGGTR